MNVDVMCTSENTRRFSTVALKSDDLNLKQNRLVPARYVETPM